MDTEAAVRGYLTDLAQRSPWQEWFADDVAFVSFTSPVRRVNGKQAFLEATKRFYGGIRSVEVRDVLADGSRACALTHYELQPPGNAPSFTSDVAEIITVRNGKIASLEIYFDSAPFPR